MVSAVEALAAHRTFFNWKKMRRLPWLVALDTPVGCATRYKAEPVDRFLDGQRAGDTSRKFFGSVRSHAGDGRARQAPRKRGFSGQGNPLVSTLTDGVER